MPEEQEKITELNPGLTSALHFGRLVETGHAWKSYTADIPAGSSLDHILAPTYWKHYTRQLKPLDVIEAMCEDGSWEASLRVTFVSRAEVKMVVRWMAEYSVDAFEAIESTTHEVKWINVGRKYGVVRKDTGEVIQDKLYPEAEAQAYLKTHLQALAR